jgi:hypothetical protein
LLSLLQAESRGSSFRRAAESASSGHRASRGPRSLDWFRRTCSRRSPTCTTTPRRQTEWCLPPRRPRCRWGCSPSHGPRARSPWRTPRPRTASSAGRSARTGRKAPRSFRWRGRCYCLLSTGRCPAWSPGLRSSGPRTPGSRRCQRRPTVGLERRHQRWCTPSPRRFPRT